MTSIISVCDLSKTYASGFQALKTIDLDMRRGEIFGLLGPNGAGKTTCFYMIVGLVAANSGEVHIGSNELTSLPIHQRARYGLSYLPQDSSIFRTLSVEDNILSILQTRKDLSDTERTQKLESLLEEFNILHLRQNKGMSLSGGERRRTEIARTLATDPKFILLDEPFAGVDPISIIDIKRIISYLSEREIGVLITDHNVRETLSICDRSYLVTEGQLICDGRPKTILRDDRVREVYLGQNFKL